MSKIEPEQNYCRFWCMAINSDYLDLVSLAKGEGVSLVNHDRDKKSTINLSDAQVKEMIRLLQLHLDTGSVIEKPKEPEIEKEINPVVKTRGWFQAKTIKGSTVAINKEEIALYQDWDGFEKGTTSVILKSGYQIIIACKFADFVNWMKVFPA